MEFQYPWQQMEIYHVDMEAWKNQEDPMFNIDYWSLQSPLRKSSNPKMENPGKVEVQAQDEIGQAAAGLVETFSRISAANIYTFVV